MSYSDIIKRLEDATGPDRELDTVIWLETTEGATRVNTPVKSSTDAWHPYVIDETRDPSGRLVTVQPYTASIDAALTLANRMLPKWRVEIGVDDKATCVLYSNDYTVRESMFGPTGQSNTAPLAIILATFRALEEKDMAA